MSEAVSATEDERAPDEATSVRPRPGRRFTSETAREMGLRSAALRAQRIEAERAPPSDEAIEDGLRRRAATSAKDAEVLLRWLSRPQTRSSGELGLEDRTEEELEGLYKRLLALAELDEHALHQLLAAQL